MQRLQLEQEDDLARQELEQELRRTLPPLEPGATLRLRHPSKLAATLPVPLGTGHRVTSFPPTPPRSTSMAGSWEPLLTPRGARYVFEQRLREVAGRLAARSPRTSDDEAGDEERAAEVTGRGGGGAAIPLRNSPKVSDGWDGAGPSRPVLERPQQHGQHTKKNKQPAVVDRAGAVPAALGSQPGPIEQRKMKVVDFTLGEAHGQGAGQAGVAAGIDLSRFASDSEGEEPAGKLTGSSLPAAAIVHPIAGAQAGLRQQQRRGQGPQRQLQAQHAQQQGQQQLRRGQQQPQQAGQQQRAVQLHQQSAGKGTSRGEPAQRAGRTTLAELPQQQAVKRPRPAVGSNPTTMQQASTAAGPEPAHEPAAVGSKRGVVEFLAGQERQQASRGHTTVDLSRFGSDSEDSGGGWQVADRSKRGVPQLDGAGDSSDEGTEPSSSSARSSGGGSSMSASSGGSDSEASSGASEDEAPSDAALAGGKPVHVVATASRGQGLQQQARQQQPATGAGGPSGNSEQRVNSEAGHQQAPAAADGTAGSPAQQAPAWLGTLLPSGARWCRQERLEQVEAAFRVNREAWVQDYRGKHRQAVRHLSRPVAKKSRRK
ncbi:hypothetical protein N2152v2_004944 [Parachlorella kessleri]